jgi:hypothetical protein
MELSVYADSHPMNVASLDPLNDVADGRNRFKVATAAALKNLQDRDTGRGSRADVRISSEGIRPA